MKNFLLISLMLLTFGAGFSQTRLQSPKEFLGYEPGEAFTRHHRVVEYFKNVDETMPNVKLIQYGETYERRPLVIALIASPENFSKLEDIRVDNLRRAGMEQGAPTGKTGIVWLSYNVHGNESNSTETSMRTLYELVNPANKKSQEWLKNTVVIIDPCINPDGRDRYANFYNQYGNFPANPDPQSREHREPWPGGRPNHYLFDLNRDWAWITQKESAARLKVYNEWMPQVHVDFHEQGINNPYYFAPAAEPYHEVITPWQRTFQDMIGRNNAKYFDENGWFYFTKERFDLFYPSYGDTYPTYSGAIGMTYEKAGGGAGGLTVETRDKSLLTLKDRVDHHFTTGMSTVEISSMNMERLLNEFEGFFKENLQQPAAPYKSYVIGAGNNPDKLKALTQWLGAHAIKYGVVGGSRPIKGFDFTSRKTETININAEDLVFNVYQPKGRFITTVFEPASKLKDSLTYDITAWNLIYACGLKAVATTERINPGKPYQPAAASMAEGEPYAWLCRYQSAADQKFLATLLKSGYRVRTAMRSFTTAGKTFAEGTLMVASGHNQHIPDFHQKIKSLALQAGRELVAMKTGYADAGPDAGSSDFSFVEKPSVAVLGGDQTNSQNHGQIWHFFEQSMEYPISIIGTDYFKSIDLWKYNVLVVPEGSYRIFDEEMLSTINRWVADGGRLILNGSACNAFADKKGFALKQKEIKKQESKPDDLLVPYGDLERKQLSSSLFGAIYKVSLDKTHPLAFGVGDIYYSLKTSAQSYPYLDKGINVGTLRGKPSPVIGFAGSKVSRELENSLVFGVEERGQGRVFYLTDNTLFRAFWENGKMIFANAVFLGGTGF